MNLRQSFCSAKWRIQLNVLAGVLLCAKNLRESFITSSHFGLICPASPCDLDTHQHFTWSHNRSLPMDNHNTDIVQRPTFDLTEWFGFVAKPNRDCDFSELTGRPNLQELKGLSDEIAPPKFSGNGSHCYNSMEGAASGAQPGLLPNGSIPIFYNLYVQHEGDAPRVFDLVSEQLALRRPDHHPVYVHSIGYRLTIPNSTVLQHHDEASELVTLHSLWQYCRIHPREKVVYLHSKGSYSNSVENMKLRKFLTTGALSAECSNLPATCNICSSRFSPLPHPHTPGNMWLARCDYVKDLVDPSEMPDLMENVVRKRNLRRRHPACDGLRRFSAEHWIHSSPSARPCDLYTDRSFTWAYDNLPEDLYPDATKLEAAPRYRLKAFVKRGKCPGRGTKIENRLYEYNDLYNISLPNESWWGWKSFRKKYAKFRLGRSQQHNATRLKQKRRRTRTSRLPLAI
jgi:hypothetical protein